MKFMERWLRGVGSRLERLGLLLQFAGADMETEIVQSRINHMDQEAMAVLSLYLSRGEEEAYASMLANARLMIASGRRQLDLTVLDLSDHFRTMPEGDDGLPVRSVASMLRRLAHKLHREYGSPDRGGRLLRLVPADEGAATGS